MSQDAFFGVLELLKDCMNSTAKDATEDAKNSASFWQSLMIVERRSQSSLLMEEGQAGRGRGGTKP